MQNISVSDLFKLEVINLCGGERLGYPTDLEIDLNERKILSITVSSCRGVSLFDKKEEYTVPWCKIECVGEDAILVKLTQNDISSCTCGTEKRKKRSFINCFCK